MKNNICAPQGRFLCRFSNFLATVSDVSGLKIICCDNENFERFFQNHSNVKKPNDVQENIPIKKEDSNDDGDRDYAQELSGSSRDQFVQVRY